MVKHIVLYTLKEGVDKDEVVKIMSVLEEQVGKIAGLNWLEVNAAHHGGADIALYSEFDSKQAFSDYTKHKLVENTKEKFMDFVADHLCADYEY